MSSLLEDNVVSVSVTGGNSLEKCKFICGQGMQKQWVESATLFMDFVGGRHGQSAKASLEAGEVIVTEVDESILKKFDKEEDLNNYLKGLKYWEKKLHEQTEENLNKFTVVIRQKLSALCGNLFSVCDLGL